MSVSTAPLHSVWASVVEFRCNQHYYWSVLEICVTINIILFPRHGGSKRVFVAPDLYEYLLPGIVQARATPLHSLSSSLALLGCIPCWLHALGTAPAVSPPCYACLPDSMETINNLRGCEAAPHFVLAGHKLNETDSDKSWYV